MIEKNFQTTNEKFTIGLKEIWEDLEKKPIVSKKEKFLYWFFQSLSPSF